MVIFHSYVKLPEGRMDGSRNQKMTISASCPVPKIPLALQALLNSQPLWDAVAIRIHWVPHRHQTELSKRSKASDQAGFGGSLPKEKALLKMLFPLT